MMKKLMICAALTALMLCGCAVGKTYGDSAPPPAVSGESDIKTLTLGGFTIEASEKFAGEQTGTGLTNAIEGLLKDKYGRDFTCWQAVYFDEESLRVDFSASPADDTSIRFSLVVEGQDELRLVRDDYLFSLNKREIIDFLIQPVADRLDYTSIDLGLINVPEESGITPELFDGQAVSLYITVPGENEKNAIVSAREDILMLIWEQAPDMRKLSLYVSAEGEHSFYTMDVTYDSFTDSLVLTHGTGGELESQKIAVRREVAVGYSKETVVRTDLLDRSGEAPDQTVTLIRSYSELHDYIGEMEKKFFFDEYHIRSKDEAGEDYDSEANKTGFNKVCAGFEPAFFDEHDLILVQLSESSSAIDYRTEGLVIDRDGVLQLGIKRLTPAGEPGAAQWHIIIETDKTVESATGVKVSFTDEELVEKVFAAEDLLKVQKALDPVMSEYGIASTATDDEAHRLIVALLDNSAQETILDYLGVIVPGFDGECVVFTEGAPIEFTTEQER